MFKFHRVLVCAAVFAAWLTAAAQQVTELPRQPRQNGTALNQEAAKELKEKSLALLGEMVAQLPQLRSAENRVRLQLGAAKLLWDYDQPRAKELTEDALTGIKEFLAGVEAGDDNYYMIYETAMQLRQEVIQQVAPHDPELALNFLRATRVLSDPHAGQSQHGGDNRELYLEMTLAGRVAAKDPARAQRMAEESLEKGVSYGLIEVLTNLRNADQATAAKLAGRIAAKLDGKALLKNPNAAQVAIGLFHLSETQAGNAGASPAAPLLTEQEKRELFNQMIDVALSVPVSPGGHVRTSYMDPSPERNNALNLLSTLQSMKREMEKYAPGKAAALNKNLAGLGNQHSDPRARLYQQYQETLNNGTVEAALEAVRQVPADMRDGLYEQIAYKALHAGDHARAKEILTENVSNQHRRQQALRNIEFQAMHRAAAEGKIEEALNAVAALPNARARNSMLAQIMHQVNSSTKKETAVAVLERALTLIGYAGRATDAEQMNALFGIASAYAAHEPGRAFEIVEALAEQFNELSAAAVTLNNFGQQYFADDELMMRNGNMVGNIAGQLTHALGPLAGADFDRAKATADKLQRLEVRLAGYLSMAQHSLPERAAGLQMGHN